MNSGTRNPDQPVFPGGSETILLVDDETVLRDMLRETLQKFGYAVLDAADGAEAVERSRRHAGRIDLLLSDVVLPGMGGRELAVALTALRPEMKVLIMSGYSDDEGVRQGVLAAELSFIQKPFTLSAIAQRVRELLDVPVPEPKQA